MSDQHTVPYLGGCALQVKAGKLLVIFVGAGVVLLLARRIIHDFKAVLGALFVIQIVHIGLKLLKVVFIFMFNEEI
jgi:hypothetical protein